MADSTNSVDAQDVGGNQVDKSCVFCERIAHGDYADRYADHVWFEPLNPVTEGHMLVVPVDHAANINEYMTVGQTGWALRYFTNDLDDYNIIISKGDKATQTIQHLHFHIVPRRKNDGLALPWTNQHEVTDLANTSPDTTTDVSNPQSGGPKTTRRDDEHH